MKQILRLNFYQCWKCFTGTELLFVINIHGKWLEQNIKITCLMKQEKLLNTEVTIYTTIRWHDMQHEYEGWRMHTNFKSENLKWGDNLWDPFISWRIIMKQALKNSVKWLNSTGSGHSPMAKSSNIAIKLEVPHMGRNQLTSSVIYQFLKHSLGPCCNLFR